VWQSYGIRAWPTQVLIDPAGYIIGGVSGEGNYELIDQVVAKAVAEFRKRGELNETPLKLTVERAKVGDLPLAFPGKVLADAKNDRLFIADSNHNRIVITKLDGSLLEIIGIGERGALDGPFDKASFYRPQGMALDGHNLYVADTENHLIRAVDLKTRVVKTVAGTGEQSREYFKQGPARSIALSSPWDLELVGRQLYIAMAGPHQIWKLDLDKQEVSTFAGSGREARLDGSLSEAGFAQPSGITSIGTKLYIADSESNIIRAIDTTTGRVETLVGGDLFEFGDVDGVGDDVRLQHPLGVVAHGSKILIADTYNHKIKELDVARRSATSFAGTGKPGQTDNATPAFYEPGGLSIANNKLYVADTNNHAIRVVDLKTRQAATLNIKGLLPPVPNTSASAAESGPAADETLVATQRLGINKDGTLVVTATLPEGYHLNPSATHRLRAEVKTGNANVKLTQSGASSTDKPGDALVEIKSKKDFTLPVRLTLKPLAVGTAELRVTLTLYYCREDNTGTCFIKTLAWRVPVEVTRDETAPAEIKLEGKLTVS
jgi:YVTN family beta-propeller protein